MKTLKIRNFDAEDPRTWRALLTVGMVAQICNVSLDTIRKWSDKGLLPLHPSESLIHRRFKKAEILEYVLNSGRTSNKHKRRKHLIFPRNYEAPSATGVARSV